MLQLTPQGLYCAQGDFHIDPWGPVDRAIITHGHADHARVGMKHYLCHNHTVPILKTRLGEDISVQGIDYNSALNFNQVKVSLHPAGHVIGSAQVRIEYKGRVAVVSGDYKTQNDGLSSPIEIIKCHEFITESTFGLPIYQWMSVADQTDLLRRWVEENERNQKISVLVGYALGKAQRIMHAFSGVKPIFVHYSIARINQAYQSVGIKLPPYEIIDLKQSNRPKKGVIIVPPSLLDTSLIRKTPNLAHAICSGWMQVRGARRWRSADAGFAISDHADWNGLIQVIKATGAEKVYVTHGQTSIFSRYLNEIGIQAQELDTKFSEGQSESSAETQT